MTRKADQWADDDGDDTDFRLTLPGLRESGWHYRAFVNRSSKQKPTTAQAAHSARRISALATGCRSETQPRKSCACDARNTANGCPVIPMPWRPRKSGLTETSTNWITPEATCQLGVPPLEALRRPSLRRQRHYRRHDPRSDNSPLMMHRFALMRTLAGDGHTVVQGRIDFGCAGADLIAGGPCSAQVVDETASCTRVCHQTSISNAGSH